MKNIRCLAVDDEPLSLRIIQKYAANLPHLDLIGTAQNAFEAMEILRQESIDLLLLDINMPKLSGISLVKSLPKSPLVIFTTAYPQYAVEGFELEAIDYLLKPFSLERFIKAINRVEEKLEFLNGGNSLVSAPNYLIVKSDKKLYKVDHESILYLQAYGDYVKIFTNEKTYLTKERLSHLEKELPNPPFLRIHRSYLISLNAIEFIEGNLVKIGKEKLPIALTYKDLLIEKLNSR